MKSKNENMRESFLLYCLEHPEERFWQALRNWTAGNIDEKVNFIFVAPSVYTEVDNDEDAVQLLQDTFYWEDDKIRPTRT